MNSHPTHPHQSCPLVFINGRSGLFSRDCSMLSTTGVLQARLRRAHHIDSVHLTYPPTQAFHWWSRAYRDLTAQSMHSQIDRLSGGFQVDVVAHSMGCDIVRELMDHTPLPIFRRIVFLAPAMERNVRWKSYPFERMLVLHNSRDAAILAGSLLPWHPFGLAGRYGFTHPDRRLRQYEMRGDAKVGWMGHGHYFREPFLTQVAGLVEGFITG